MILSRLDRWQGAIWEKLFNWNYQRLVFDDEVIGTGTCEGKDRLLFEPSISRRFFHTFFDLFSEPDRSFVPKSSKF